MTICRYKRSQNTNLLASDRNIQYEQNLQQAKVSVIIMVARTNRLNDLLPLVSKVNEALPQIKAGELIEVSLNL